MSILAGAIHLSRGELNVAQVRALKAGFDFPGWTHQEFQRPDVLILDASLSLYGSPDWSETDAYVVAIAGRMYSSILDENEVRSLAPALLGDTVRSFLRSANGTFVVLAYDKECSVLRIASDSLGARPLYYMTVEHSLFFSTSIDLLRSLSFAEINLDLTAYAEQEAMCYPLGNRTVFREINVLTDNQLLTVRDGDYAIESYFDWCDVQPFTREEPNELARASAIAVSEAVRARIDFARQTETSLLSGGLDSRVIVSELVRNGRPVRALNLSRRGYQDDVFAARYAGSVGVSLERREWSPMLPGVTAGETTARMLAAALAPVSHGVAFSGDGGGETLGFLLFEPLTCQLLASGNLEAAVNAHLHWYQPPRRLLQSDASQSMRGVAQKRLTEDILTRGEDLQKAFQRSVLLNDLRCHLHEYFNRIDQSKVELLLPFYDRRIVESVLRITTPLNEHLQHRFYSRVVEQLGQDVRSVAWQVYPGREPSPVPPDPNLPDQWSEANWELGDALSHSLRNIQKSGRLSRHVRSPIVWVALMLHRLRIRNHTSTFKMVVNLSELGLSPSGAIFDER